MEVPLLTSDFLRRAAKLQKFLLRERYWQGIERRVG